MFYLQVSTAFQAVKTCMTLARGTEFCPKFRSFLFSPDVRTHFQADWEFDNGSGLKSHLPPYRQMFEK
jgi:hypothetical protein